jgi:hypothetical protein
MEFIEQGITNVEGKPSKFRGSLFDIRYSVLKGLRKKSWLKPGERIACHSPP